MSEAGLEYGFLGASGGTTPVVVTCVLLLLVPLAKLDMGGGGFSGNLPLCVVVCMGSMGLLGMPVDLVLSNCASTFVAKLMASVKELMVCIETWS